jgi:hypothetical protein
MIQCFLFAIFSTIRENNNDTVKAISTMVSPKLWKLLLIIEFDRAEREAG